MPCGPRSAAADLGRRGSRRRAGGTGPAGAAVDDELRTALPHVFAIGDAIGGLMFTHVSTYEAPIAIANMLDGARLRPDYRTMPRTTFTSPELAGAGLGEEQAVVAAYEVEVRRYDLGRLGEARALGDRRGRVTIVLDAPGTAEARAGRRYEGSSRSALR